MRFTTTILLASFLIGTAACASSASSGGGSTETNKPQSGADGTGTDTNKPPAEKPLTAKSVCETIETDANFGKGCSGTGSGQEVCALEDYSCGANKCVYDSRGDGYAFYCAPRCNAADPSLACPLGHECVTPTAGCGGDAADGVCTRRVDYACKDVGDASGTLVEGLDGALLVLKWTGTQGSLRQKTSSGWRTLTTWADTASSGYVYGVARSDRQLLIVTSGTEILVDETGAKATKRASTTSYTPAIGVGADGGFVALELASGAYATVSKRDAAGKWTEIGPTRKRIASLATLQKGFIARCGEDLCTSGDGEAFEPIASPPDVAITETTRFTAAGVSHEDFYLALDGRLFHHRKGKWVEEGPRGQPRGTSGSSSYDDVLRVSSTGAVTFITYAGAASTGYGSAYTTYTTTTAGECWKTTTASDLRSATLIGDALMWTSSSYGDLCTLKID